MKKFQLTVRALGYDTLTKTVDALSLADARKFTRRALREWEMMNDVDKATSSLAFVAIHEVKQ